MTTTRTHTGHLLVEKDLPTTPPDPHRDSLFEQVRADLAADVDALHTTMAAATRARAEMHRGEWIMRRPAAAAAIGTFAAVVVALLLSRGRRR